MNGAPHTVDRPESATLDRQAACQMLLLTPDEHFEFVVDLATRVFGTAAALAVPDRDRVRLKCVQGLKPDELAGAATLAGLATDIAAPLQLDDTAADPPGAHGAATGEAPTFRAFAAAPLLTGQHPSVGALCLFGRDAHAFGKKDVATLQRLAQLVAQLFRAHRMAGLDFAPDPESPPAFLPGQEAPEAGSSGDSDAVLEIAAGGVVTKVNRLALQLLAAGSIEAARGRPFTDFVPPEDRETADRLLQAALSGRARSRVFRLRSLDGNESWAEAHGIPLSDARGEVDGALVVCRDVTTSRAVSQALVEALRRNESILASCAEGIHGIDSTGRVLFENRAALELLGYDENEIKGRPAHALIHHHRPDGSVYPPEQCPILNTLRDGKTRAGREEILWRKDGTPMPVEMTVAPMIDSRDGHVTGAVVNFRDTSTQRLGRALRGLEIRVLDQVSAGAPLPEILRHVTESVDQLLPDVLSSVFLVDDTGVLRLGAAGQLPEAYVRALDGAAVGEGVACTGTAAHRRETVTVQDLDADAAWDGIRRHLGDSGIHACCSTPVLDAGGAVLATFDLHYTGARSPDPLDSEITERIVYFTRAAIERTRHLEELERSEARYRSVYNLVPVSIWEEDWTEVIRRVQEVRDSGVTRFEEWFEEHPEFVLDALRRVRILDFNDATLQLFEADRKEHLSESLETVFSTPDTLPGFIGELVALAEGERLHQTQMRLRTVRGRMIHTRLNMTFPPAGDKSGRVLVSVMDMTERFEAERRFEIVAQATSDVVWDWNLATDGLWWSEGMAETYGYAAGQQPRDSRERLAAIHPDDAERVARAWETVIGRQKNEWRGEYRFRHADGRYLQVVDQGFVIRDENGDPVRMVGSMEDVTERRALEEHLRQAQRLDAIGQLTGGMAHDFNNLLTVILGSTESLAERLEADGGLKSLADLTLEAATRGEALTRRLLAFARRQPLDPHPTDVNRHLAGIDTLLRRTLGEQVQLKYRPGGDLWLAMIDPGQLEDAILNLCLNARDAMPDGGTLTIETANARIDSTQASSMHDVEPGEYVLIAVSDTGEGMGNDTLQRAFEPFFTTKEVGRGSGLGLSMVYGFIKQSKGHIRLYSEPGRGTTVKLYLPRESGGRDAGYAGDEEEQSLRLGNERILLVEDNELVREHAVGQLSALGYEVVAAADAREALAVLESDSAFDLLFTDIVMPGGMSGTQLGQIAGERWPDVKILYTSGYTERAAAHNGGPERGGQFLSKPYRLKELSAKLRQVLDEPDSK